MIQTKSKECQKSLEAGFKEFLVLHNKETKSNERSEAKTMIGSTCNCKRYRNEKSAHSNINALRRLARSLEVAKLG